MTALSGLVTRKLRALLLHTTAPPRSMRFRGSSVLTRPASVISTSERAPRLARASWVLVREHPPSAVVQRPYMPPRFKEKRCSLLVCRSVDVRADLRSLYRARFNLTHVDAFPIFFTSRRLARITRLSVPLLFVTSTVIRTNVLPPRVAPLYMEPAEGT